VSGRSGGSWGEVRVGAVEVAVAEVGDRVALGDERRDRVRADEPADDRAPDGAHLAPHPRDELAARRPVDVDRVPIEVHDPREVDRHAVSLPQGHQWS
jgi:hypothetical protein